ncbi:MAG: HAMP domain-containing protein, partial [Rhodococcus sp. (in: high G+C Gram-positive bacteria)]
MTRRLPRPLDPLGSFKLKVSLIVGLVLAAASITFWFGAGWQFRYALLAALVISLVATQVVAHGMTSPLRDMTVAAGAMARGDYSRRVRATSRDEIGQLAAAFNTMSTDLEAAEKYRRELIGNVSHELKTPIAALRAVLENLVDGVSEPDPAILSVALRQTEKLG